MASKVRAELSLGAQDGQARLEYTRRAYRRLPRLDRPRILDVGCGRGGPSLALARLSGGRVTGLDIDQPSLDYLAGRARASGLASRIRLLRGSMLDIGLRDGSFDIVWAEGAIFAIGFERGLREWCRLIRPGGFLVVHDMAWLRAEPPQACLDHVQGMFPGIRSVPAHLEAIPRQGYGLLGHFSLPEDVWQLDYYGPLQDRIHVLRGKYAGDAEAQGILDGAQREVDLYMRCARWFGSAFFIMQKGDRV